VTANSEVPSSFRSSAVRPGSLALIRIGITETLSRRRLIAYLVRADLKKSGADDFLHKPLDIDELLRRICRLLDIEATEPG